MSDVRPSRIPLEMWFEVFKGLPVKTLGKCCCVCNSWRSLIRSQHFRDAHFKHYTQNESNSLLLDRSIGYTGSETPHNEQYELFCESSASNDGNGLELCHSITCPFLALRSNDLPIKEFRLIGSVYGLLCLVDASRILLWNPLLNQSITLPMSCANDTIGYTGCSELGFGYDARNNDHKVVKISYGSSMVRSERIPPPMVELYSVREGSWRQISAHFLVDRSIHHCTNMSPCFLDGVVYWLTADTNTHFYINCLLSFDFEEEQFGKLELPNEIVEQLSSYAQVLEYRGKLSVSDCDGYLPCTIWVKGEENGVGSSSWSRILHVVFDDSIGIFQGTELHFGKNGEIYGFVKSSNSQSISYNPKNGHIKELYLRPSYCGWLTKVFATYTESLVLLR